jgi:hypothetical protein
LLATNRWCDRAATIVSTAVRSDKRWIRCALRVARAVKSPGGDEEAHGPPVATTGTGGISRMTQLFPLPIVIDP